MTLEEMIEIHIKISEDFANQIKNWIHITNTEKEAEADKRNFEAVKCAFERENALILFLKELQYMRIEAPKVADEAFKKGLQHGKEAAELAKPIYKYKTVRSFTSNCKTSNNDLIAAFNEGFEFVRASEVVDNSRGGYCDYIEYILRKEIVNQINEGGTETC